MAREMYLAGVDPDDLKPDPKPEGPKTAKGKWENYWYHYKWITLGAIFVVVILAVVIAQMINRDDPDYSIVVVTKYAMSPEQQTALKAELEVSGRDLDGDGKIEVRIDSLYVGTENSQMLMANQQKLQIMIASGDALFFAFEPEYYETYIEQNEHDDMHFFTPLDGIDAPGKIKDGRLWNWKDDSRREEMPDLAGLPENLYFGVRGLTGTADKKGNEQLHEQYMELLDAFIQHKQPDPPGEETASQP